MRRHDLEAQIQETVGFVPGWMRDMPDAMLDQYWSGMRWVLSDTALSARDKALIAFGAATATHCTY